MPGTVWGTQYLEIASIPMSIVGAWRILDHTPLEDAADQRGGDILIPGSSGVLAQRRRKTVTTVSLKMVILGNNDKDGAAHSTLLIGAQKNVLWLRANIVAPTGATDGTRSATWHLLDGSTKTANVHVRGLRVSPFGIERNAILDLSIPAGEFA